MERNQKIVLILMGFGLIYQTDLAWDAQDIEFENALNLSYEPYVRSGSRLKWIYDPDNNDYVFVHEATPRKYTFIKPSKPDTALPNGVYYWRSTNQQSFCTRIAHGAWANTGARVYPLTIIKKIIQLLEANSALLLRSNFFEDTMGLSESVWRQQLSKLYNINCGRGDRIPLDHAVYGSAGTNLTTNPRSQAIFNGTLYKQKLSWYRSQVADKLEDQLSGPDLFGSFSIIQAPASTDIRKLQTQYPNAFFQIASNFNALEGGMGNWAVELTDMSGTHAVQGEEAAMATAGAAIYRKYYASPINMLSGLTKVFAISSGNNHQPVITDVRVLPITDKAMGGFLVCTHDTISVTSADDNSLSASNKPLFNRQIPTSGSGSIRVSHILVAAHDLNPKRNPNGGGSDHQAAAKAVQRAIYEATLLSAYKHGTPGATVILTMVGGGSFQNKEEWIASAIENMKKFIVVSGLDVRIVIRGSQDSFLTRMRNVSSYVSTKVAELAHDHSAYVDMLEDQVAILRDNA